MIYHYFAEQLINRHIAQWQEGRIDDHFTYISIPGYGDFGFEIMFDYSGLMAQPSRTGRNKGRVKRPKQGLFDIFVHTGSFFGTGGMSHRDILESVIRFTTFESCIAVWRGEFPDRIAENDDEMAILTTIALAFFEQEINWGNEDWQRYTYFSPKVRIPNRIRPRDMLMGYISQAYDLGIDNIAYWMNARPTTTTFMSPDRSNYGYDDYPLQYKRYFTDLQNDEFADALMVGDVRADFRRVASICDDNPHFSPI